MKISATAVVLAALTSATCRPELPLPRPGDDVRRDESPSHPGQHPANHLCAGLDGHDSAARLVYKYVDEAAAPSDSQAIRFTDKNPAHYEEDHFISLELGGNPRDENNLWPEMWGTPGTPLTSRGSFPSSIVGAKAKDQVEKALNTAICDGTMTLQEAQHIISTDWFKYYRDHVLK